MIQAFIGMYFNKAIVCQIKCETADKHKKSTLIWTERVSCCFSIQKIEINHA